MAKVCRAAVLGLLVLSTTIGCSRYYWSKAGASPEQFARDNQECLGNAARALPPGATPEAVEQFYRACLGSRGYVRDKQIDPPPPGSYRGVESGEDFEAAVRSAGAAPRQTFEQQLAHLDDLKARGRITEEEYATMRRRLVEGATPSSLTPAPVAVPVPAPPTLDGRWYGRNGATLDIRSTRGRQLQWEWELPGDRVTTRATGTGTASGDQITLSGRQTPALATVNPIITFTLTREGNVLRGVYQGPSNLPINVEFTRERR